MKALVVAPHSDWPVAVVQAAKDWADFSCNARINFLFDINKWMAHIFHVEPPRFYTSALWQVYKGAYGYEPHENTFGEGYAFYLCDLGGGNPIIVMDWSEERYKINGFFEAIETLIHEFGHYLLDVYDRKFRQMNGRLEQNLPLLCDNQDIADAVKDLMQYLVEYELFARDVSGRYEYKERLVRSMEDMDFLSKERADMMNLYLEIMDERAVQSMAEDAVKSLQAAIWWIESAPEDIFNQPSLQFREILLEIESVTREFNLPLDVTHIKSLLIMNGFHSRDEFLSCSNDIESEILCLFTDVDQTNKKLPGRNEGRYTEIDLKRLHVISRKLHALHYFICELSISSAR